ncbi:MAG: DUF2281 domain-containing protein [Acidobacteria bacterium]|nr:DUF2281 domain-containing protein [Acidobacteriota bacterium]
MTDEKALMSQIHSLPEGLKEEVVRFVDNLTKRAKTEMPKSRLPRPKAGSMPGVFKIAPDFDDPIPGFEEYM